MTATNYTASIVAIDRPLEVREGGRSEPDPNQIVVKNFAVAVNPVDWVIQTAGVFMYRWIKKPFVLGSDVAGEVVAVGVGVSRFSVGDRVLGLAVGAEKDVNDPRQGAFQEYTVLAEGLASRIPDGMTFEAAAVLPLGLSTAACGLFQKGQLALRHPGSALPESGETVLVWGGSTSVGSNAIQLAVAAGYRVVTTASPRNFDYVRGLGASEVFDYASDSAVADVTAAVAGGRLAGTLAIGAGSARPCVDIAHAAGGSRRVALASPAVSFAALAGSRRKYVEIPRLLWRLVSSTTFLMVRARVRGIQARFIWGSSLKDDEVGDLVFREFLPGALEDGSFVPAPPPRVVGRGLRNVQLALDTQRAGVSAEKIVVQL